MEKGLIEILLKRNLNQYMFRSTVWEVISGYLSESDMVVVQLDGNNEQILVRTAEDDRVGRSFIDVVTRVDSCPDDFCDDPNFQQKVSFLTTDAGEFRIGFVLDFVIKEIQRVDMELFDCLFIMTNDIKNSSIKGLKFRDGDMTTRNIKLDKLATTLRDNSILKEIKGWRDEKYCVYAHGSPYVLVERSMAGLLGILTSGIHVNGYVFDDSTKEIKFWIPRRSKKKQTWPYMLDNIIAGGLAHPYGIYETVLKESIEEANLSESVIKKYLVSVGAVSYLHCPIDISTDAFTEEESFIVGEIEYLYDLRLPADIIPTPNDNEVDSFNLMALQDVVDALFTNEFKPNCGLVMLEFLIRHGYVNSENEPKFLEIQNRMHRKLPFPSLN